MRLHFSASLVIIAFVSLVALGCAQETEIIAAQPTIPATPDGTVMAVAQNLADNHPEILWEALPASYRTDITELTQLFAAKMDPEIYDRAMAIALSMVDVHPGQTGHHPRQRYHGGHRRRTLQRWTLG